ncbi:hypothetical protein ACH41H_47030 [Streptomyces sp. NPDC020800]
MRPPGAAVCLFCLVEESLVLVEEAACGVEASLPEPAGVFTDEAVRW